MEMRINLSRRARALVIVPLLLSLTLADRLAIYTIKRTV